jgi:Secretion system C-terminal sorting domain
MNIKAILSTLILILSIYSLKAQHVDYTYDNRGNRLTRTTVQQLKAGAVQFPVINPKDIPVEDAKAEPVLGELSTLVYPNPNKGFIKIDISNLPVDAKTEARVYDLSGQQQVVKMNFDSSSEIDISQLKDGIYILRIKINEKVFDWKVVKGH